MTQRNDDAFSAFLLKMAERIYEADVHNSEVMGRHNRLIDLASTGVYANTSTPNAAMAQRAVSALSQLSQIAAMHATSNAINKGAHTHSLAMDFRTDQLVKQSDMEIIRAYFRGEDIIVTLLAQER